jgi:DUF3102 family protein
VEIGNRLIAVKDALDHGEWLPWLDEQFGWSDRTARDFIAVADAFGDKLAPGAVAAAPGALAAAPEAAGVRVWQITS